ncbi:MAG: MFS transporter [Rhodospirillaceae bacterium]|nr:MFS transporter [Rhodospirillaceae bacterium]
MSFAVLLAVTGVAAFGPLLVDMVADLNLTVPVAGQLVTTAAATWAATALLVGPFSDTYGRKPILLAGTSFLTLGSLGLAFSPGFVEAVACCVLIGIGGGMVPATCIAVIGDIFPAPRKPMSIATITMQPGMSSVIAVPLAAVLGDFAGWRVAFAALGGALLLATLILYRLVPNNRPPSAQLNFGERFRRVAACSVTWRMAGTNLLTRITWGAVITFFPAFLIVSYGLQIVEVALPVAIVALGGTIAPLLGGKIGQGRKRHATTAALLLTAIVPGLGIFLLTPGPWISVALASFFLFLMVPVTTVLMIVIAEAGGAYRGSLNGVISCTNWGGTALGAAIGGLLVAHVGYGALSFLLTGAILASGLLMIIAANDSAVARAKTHFAASPDRIEL